MALNFELKLNIDSIWDLINRVLPNHHLIDKSQFSEKLKSRYSFLIFEDGHVYSNEKGDFVSEVGIEPIELIPSDPFGPILCTTFNILDSFCIQLKDMTSDCKHFEGEVIIMYFPISDIIKAVGDRSNIIMMMINSRSRQVKRIEKILVGNLGMSRISKDEYSSAPWSKWFNYKNEFGEFLLEKKFPENGGSIIASNLKYLYELLEQD